MWKKINNSLKLTVLILLGISIFISSCDNRPTGVLNKKQMENLMVDMHLLEGALSASGVMYDSQDEQKKYYHSLFQKYGITQQGFDSCLSWYTRHPKDFERIYLNVSARIDTLNKEVNTGKFHPEEKNRLFGTAELWRLPLKYTFSKDSARTCLPFEITDSVLLAGDVYELSFRHRIAPVDSSKNPHVVMYVNYWNGKVDSIYTKTHNDSVLRRYKLRFKARYDLKIKSLSGQLLGNDSSKGKMSAYLDSIQLVRFYNPYKQDSIRSAIYKADTTKIKIDTTKTSKDSSVIRKQLPLSTPQ